MVKTSGNTTDGPVPSEPAVPRATPPSLSTFQRIFNTNFFSLVIPIKASQTSSGWSFGLRKNIGSVSGNVFDDSSNYGVHDGRDGLGDVTVELTDSKGNTHMTLTDMNGDYRFDGILEGSGKIMFKKSGYVDTFTNPRNVVVEGGNTIMIGEMGMHVN
ncbi:MAG: SdrD B-like domain-containing protein [Deinococcaceae bacterium]